MPESEIEPVQIFEEKVNSEFDQRGQTIFACRSEEVDAVLAATGMTKMLLGLVGQSCWQTPQPMQPMGFTSTRSFFNSMAAVPSGQ